MLTPRGDASPTVKTRTRLARAPPSPAVARATSTSSPAARCQPPLPPHSWPRLAERVGPPNPPASRLTRWERARQDRLDDGSPNLIAFGVQMYPIPFEDIAP